MVCLLEALLHNCPLRASRATAHNPSSGSTGLEFRTTHQERFPPLVIEIAQDNYQTFVLLTKNISTGYLDIVKGNKRCTGCRRVRRFDRLGRNAGTPLNKKNSQALGGPTCNGEIVAEMAIRNPSANAETA